MQTIFTEASLSLLATCHLFKCFTETRTT
ncbi:hypothetical protein LINGRAHAP2_LOCUS5197 [Linum grandiflorum]